MRNLYEGNIYKSFILFAIPMVLGGVLSKLYETVDTAIAGIFLGDKALAAIGALSPFTQFISSFFWGAIPSFGVYCAILFGKKDYERLRDISHTFLVFILIISLIIEVVCIVFTRQILIIFKTDPLIIEDAISYFRYYMIAFFFLHANYLMFSIFNAMGISVFPFIVTTVSTILNVTGNILLVAVFNIGVKGLAISTIIASSSCFCLYYIRYVTLIKKLNIAYKIKVKFKMLSSITGYIIPSSCQQFLIYFASIILSPIVNGFGYAATAAYTITTMIRDIIANCYQDSSKTLSNYIGQCLGARKYEKINYSIFVAFIQLLIFTVPLVAICALFPETISTLFLQGEYSAETVLISSTYLRYFLPFILFNAVNNLFHNLYRAFKAKTLLLLSSFTGCVTRIVFTFILVPHYGINGFFFGWVISYFAEALLCGIVYLTKVWMSKEVKEYYNSLKTQKA